MRDEVGRKSGDVPAARVTVARAMGLVALAALGLAWPPLGPIALPSVVWLAGGRTPGLVLLALYAPTEVGFFSDCDHCRGVWSWFWPVVPGLFGGEWLRRSFGLGRSSDIAGFALAGAVTLAYVAVAVTAARRGPRWLAATLCLTAALGTLAAVAVHAAIRS